jgi:hypothetical protein
MDGDAAVQAAVEDVNGRMEELTAALTASLASGGADALDAIAAACAALARLVCRADDAPAVAYTPGAA